MSLTAHAPETVGLFCDDPLWEPVVARLLRGAGLQTACISPESPAEHWSSLRKLLIAAPRCAVGEPRETAINQLVLRPEAMALAATGHRLERIVYLSSADASLWRGDRIYWNEARMPAGRPPCRVVELTRVGEEVLRVRATDSTPTLVLRPACLWSEPTASEPGYFEGLPKRVGRGNRLFATCHLRNLAQAINSALTCHPRHREAVYYVSDDTMLTQAEFLASFDFVRNRRFRPREQSACSRRRRLRQRYASHFDITLARRELAYSPE